MGKFKLRMLRPSFQKFNNGHPRQQQFRPVLKTEPPTKMKNAEREERRDTPKKVKGIKFACPVVFLIGRKVKNA